MRIFKNLTILFVLLISSLIVLSSIGVESRIEQVETIPRVSSRYIFGDISTPVIDGVLSNFEDEWNIFSVTNNVIDFGSGTLQLKYDKTRFYFLLNVRDDAVEDNQPGLKTPSDSFTFVFDVDNNNEITPNVDKRYTFNTGNNILYQQYFTGPNTFSSSNVSQFSIVKPGYGCSFQDGSFSLSFFPELESTCIEHRFYEIAIDLEELGIDNRQLEHGFGFTYNSPNPSINIKYPEDLNTNFTNLVQVRHIRTQSRYTYFTPGQEIDFISKEGNDLQVDIEVVQAVQNYYNGIQLVANKDTVARVYVETDGPGDKGIPAIVYLYGERNGVLLPESPLGKVIREVPLVVNKSVTEYSANFLLPDSWARDDLKLYAKVIDVYNDKVIDSMEVDVSFLSRRNPLIYVIDINTGTADTPRLGTSDRRERQIEAFKAMFASPDITIVKKPWTTIGACTSCNFYDINDKLEYYYMVLFWTRVLKGVGFNDFPDQIYGFAPSGGGLAYVTYWNNHLGRVSVGNWAGESVMAHEVNHNLQRGITYSWGGHVFNYTSTQSRYGCGDGAYADREWPLPPETDAISRQGIEVTGFDTRSMTAISGGIPDIMSYCRTRDDISKWVSGYRWQKWMNLFPDLSSTFSASSVNKISKTDQFFIDFNPNHFLISTSLNIDNTGSIDSMFNKKASIFTSLLDTSVGNASIQVLDSSNSLINTFYFNASFTDIDGNTLESIKFNLQVPYYTNANKIVFRIGDTVVDEVINYNSVPSITIESPISDTIWESNLYDIKWTATDTNTNDLTTTLYYSADNGETWEPLTGYLKDVSSFTVDSSSLNGSTQAKIRVEVSNGFNISYKDSDTFTVKDAPPKINITTPFDKAVFTSNDTISFKATAIDFEGKTIGDNKSYWKIDGEIFMQGKSFSTSFTNGTHSITFVAFDEKGVSSELTIDIFIGVSPDDYFELFDVSIEKNYIYAVALVGALIVALFIIRKLR